MGRKNAARHDYRDDFPCNIPRVIRKTMCLPLSTGRAVRLTWDVGAGVWNREGGSRKFEALCPSKELLEIEIKYVREHLKPSSITLTVELLDRFPTAPDDGTASLGICMGYSDCARDVLASRPDEPSCFDEAVGLAAAVRRALSCFYRDGPLGLSTAERRQIWAAILPHKAHLILTSASRIKKAAAEAATVSIPSGSTSPEVWHPTFARIYAALVHQNGDSAQLKDEAAKKFQAVFDKLGVGLRALGFKPLRAVEVEEIVACVVSPEKVFSTVSPTRVKELCLAARAYRAYPGRASAGDG